MKAAELLWRRALALSCVGALTLSAGCEDYRARHPGGAGSGGGSDRGNDPENPAAYAGEDSGRGGLADHPGELTDADGDGHLAGADCDDSDPDNWDGCDRCVDEDGDGAFFGCDDYTATPGPDCDDSDPTRFPGNAEACDGQDDDCDAATTAPGGELDRDRDGHLAGADCDDNDPDNWDGCDRCVDADGDGAFSGCDNYTATLGPDCDDSDATRFPGNAEACNGQDDDCDARTAAPGGELDRDEDGQLACADCDDSDPDNWDGCDRCVDADGDGAFVECDNYQTILGPDCDDTDPNRVPGKAEACDGIDNDCDPSTTAPGGELDSDGDKHLGCEDCDDSEPARFPGNPELCDGLDNDCDAATAASGGEADADQDGYPACEDCDDGDALQGICLRNVILLVADGMGFEQALATRMYLSGADAPTSPLVFETLPSAAQVTTHSANNAITDSAAAATAMATGYKVANGVLSLDTLTHTDLQTVLELHQASGKRSGLVTIFDSVLDATPAAFGAHAASRNYHSEIAEDLLYSSRPNVLLGGTDSAISTLTAAGTPYTVVQNALSLLALLTDPDPPQFVLGEFADALHATNPELPTLRERTQVALHLLQGDPDGFFLMSEQAITDKCGHQNDLLCVMEAVIEFDRTVELVLSWAGGRRDTLIAVVSDHETGGLTVTETDPVAGVIPDHTFSSTQHTGANVPLYATGYGCEHVSGVLDNTDIYSLLAAGAIGP